MLERNCRPLQWCACAALALILTSCSGQSSPPPAAPASLDLAAQRFSELCAACHGKQGRGGGVGPDLTASRYKYGKERSQIITSISEGRTGGMPGYRSHIPADEIALLADYLISLH